MACGRALPAISWTIRAGCCPCCVVSGRIFRIGRLLLVTRNEDVRDILERGDEFETPYGPEMAELAGGSNFILGMQDGPDYRRMKSAVLSAFPPAEVEAAVRPIAARHSRDIVMRAAPGFDAVGGLLKILPARICRDYFGVLVDDETEFADWSTALSALFFSDPFANAAIRELAMVAADRLTRTIDQSITAVREGRAKADTPLARLVAQLDQGRVSIKDIHSIMLGMIAGFAPTNLLAGANCLDVILSKPEAQQAVEQAVAEDDTQKLDRAILEAMRFRPIWIGPWRYAARDAVIARGTRRERVVKAGTTVMPATLSAMFDPDAVDRPNEFDTTRPHRDYLVYGHGIHLCIGAEVARVQIGESLRALFGKKGVRRAAGKAGRLRRLGAYPESLSVDFERAPLCQIVPHAMITVICPLKPTALPDRSRHSDRRLQQSGARRHPPGSRCYGDHPFRQHRGCRNGTQPRIVRPPGAGTRPRTVRRRDHERGDRRVRRTCRSAGARPLR